VAAAVCLLAVGPCDQCPPRDRKIFSVVLSGVKIFFPLAAALHTESRGAAPPTDAYAGVRAGPGGAGSAYAYPPLDLWAPFDLAVSFGIFDPAAGEQGPFGAEACLRAESLDGATFFAVCASLLPGRIELSAHASTETLADTLVLGGASRADLRVEADGENVNFYGRETGADAWSLFASTPFGAQDAALRPLVAATLVPQLSEVGFDTPHFSSAPPPDPSPEEAVAYELQLGLSDAVEAGLLLDGEGQDPAAAAVLLASARGHFDAARAAAATLAGPGRKTARKISQASKKLAKAQGQFAAGQFGKAFKSYAKAGKVVLQALDALLPAPVL